MAGTDDYDLKVETDAPIQFVVEKENGFDLDIGGDEPVILEVTSEITVYVGGSLIVPPPDILDFISKLDEGLST